MPGWEERSRYPLSEKLNFSGASLRGTQRVRPTHLGVLGSHPQYPELLVHGIFPLFPSARPHGEHWPSTCSTSKSPVNCPREDGSRVFEGALALDSCKPEA